MSDAVVFSVIDTETTGIYPGGTDRVVEVAIVGLDGNGHQISRWETLVNPHRDLGAQHVHGITGADIHGAPSFDAIAGELAWRLQGTIPVAHNLSFDARFLMREFERAGMEVPATYFDHGLCTMRLAQRYLPGGPRRLEECCTALGESLGRAHCAGDDAEAAGRLLARYMTLEGDPYFYPAAAAAAPVLTGFASEPRAVHRPHLRSAMRGDEAPTFLARLVSGMAPLPLGAAEAEYVDLLDRALLDRHLSFHEQDALVDAARSGGIDRARALAIHADYLSGLAVAALVDGVVTADERADLNAVAELLGLGVGAVDDALGRAVGETGSPAPSPGRGDGHEAMPAVRRTSILIEEGALICLTGEMSRPRPEIAALLEAAGYHCHSGVTKKVGLVVAADPDSESGKARKARDYGIPVVGEDFIWTTLLR